MVILLPGFGIPVGIPTREWLPLRSLDGGHKKRSNVKHKKNEIVCEA